MSFRASGPTKTEATSQDRLQADYSTGRKSSFPTPQTGQVQSSGISSNGVPAGIPPSGSPIAGSYTQSQALQTYFFIIVNFIRFIGDTAKMPPQNCFPKSIFKVVKDFKDLKEKSAEKISGAFLSVARTDYLMRS